MTKYRIKQIGLGFYPQEKKSILHAWRWLDIQYSDIDWVFFVMAKRYARCLSHEQAERVIERRKAYLAYMVIKRSIRHFMNINRGKNPFFRSFTK